MTTTGNEGHAFEIAPTLAKQMLSPAVPFKLLSVLELLALPTPCFIVRKVFRAKELVVLYGDPGCCKTFVVLDIVLAVAMGVEWWGRRTTRGRVVYLAGEGTGGLGRRIQAWAIEHKCELKDLDVLVLPHSVEMMKPSEFERLRLALSELVEQPIIIVVDTLARYMVGGDENSAQDMGVFIDRCATLRDATGATIIVVHHKRKGNAAERGSSALRGAADVMIEVIREENRVEVIGEKSKDDAPLPRMYLKTKSVWLGNDEDNEVITSLVLEQGEAPVDEQGARVVQLGEPEVPADHGAVIRRVLATLFGGQASGKNLKAASGLKPSTHYEALEAEITAGRVKSDGRRYPIYVLTPEAPEYRSPSPSPDKSTDSSGLPDQSSRESESASTNPLKGVDANSDSDSRSKSITKEKRRRRKRKPAPKSKVAGEEDDADA